MKHLRLLLLFYIAMAILSCGSKQDKEESEQIGKKEFEIEKNPVDTIILRQGNFNSQLISNGKLRALNKSSLRFPSSGILRVLNVKNGSQVKAGDIIAILDTRDSEASLSQALHNMEKAKIELEDKLLGYGYKIQDSLNIPAETMRIARLHSGYDDAIFSLQSAERNVQNCTLIAPVSGKIANLNTKLYEYPSGEEFCQVINDALFDVEFAILESEFNDMKNGQRVLLSTFSNPDKRYSGRVTEINPTVNDQGQITIRAQFNNPGELIDGMNVKVYVESIVPNKLVVPKSAVLIRDNQEVLFRVDKEGKAAWTYVHTLMSNSDSYVVVPNEDKNADLNEGDIVIISGNLNLAHGSSIEIRSK
ncbi:MAG: efflux RND transporter periplasmic adaptor subunit [Odoribacter sp.]|nr:efflux RND transporter periplasmic adaptor subunit [Odoribacter sp.]